MIKRKIAEYLRMLNLLQFADYFFYLKEILKNRKSNQLFEENNKEFKTPPSHLSYDAYNHTNSKIYHDMGSKHAELISDLIQENIQKSKIRIYEWGCGPARVLRHLKKIKTYEEIELFGTDYNEESIEWCKNNISNISFQLNNLEPPLPREIKDCDCIYAISIFTHLSEKMHHAWIQELFKALKPNGILIFTTQGDAFRNRLLLADRKIFDSGQLVIKDNIMEGKKHFSAYHPQDFIRNNLLKDYVVTRHIPNPASYLLEQEVWVVKKAAASGLSA